MKSNVHHQSIVDILNPMQSKIEKGERLSFDYMELQLTQIELLHKNLKLAGKYHPE